MKKKANKELHGNNWVKKIFSQKSKHPPDQSAQQDSA
jgi:hypothetical protein